MIGVMYEAIFREFSARCCAKLAGGEALEDWEFEAFTMLLEARELSGHTWLGAMAGGDGSIDTVTGRCGLPPARVPTWLSHTAT